MKILFLGENWYGSCARACCYALRRRGCSVLDIDLQTFVPRFRKKLNRVLVRIVRPSIVAEYNDAVLETAASYRPDFLLAFKAPLILPETLEQLRGMRINLYNYFPDRIMSALGTPLEKSLPLYDCVFDTKTTWDIPKGALRLRQKVFLPHGYDSEIYRPTALSARDREDLGCDILYAATWSPRKERILHELLNAMPKANLRIYGNQWFEFCGSYLVRPHIAGPAIYADRLAAAVCAAKVNLGIMGITEAMTDYHAFHQIAPSTPAIILELGFLSYDRDLLQNHTDKLTQGIVNGFLCFLTPAALATNQAPTVPAVPTATRKP